MKSILYFVVGTGAALLSLIVGPVHITPIGWAAIALVLLHGVIGGMAIQRHIQSAPRSIFETRRAGLG